MLRVALGLALLALSGCTETPRSCAKMKELCGTEPKDCRELRADVQEEFGQKAVDTLDGCVLQANTCSAAAGCVSGEAAKASVAAAAEFMNAFVDTMTPESADACVKRAKTPAEAAGCKAGAVGRALEARVSEFAEGVKNSR